MKHYAEIVGGIALALLGVILFIALLVLGCLEFVIPLVGKFL